MLVQTGPLNWQGADGPVSLIAKQRSAFRILSLRADFVEGAPENAPPLTVGSVQLLHQDDLKRDIGSAMKAATTIFGHTYVQPGGVGY
eukprot:3545146-Amphidinium_carterae.1